MLMLRGSSTLMGGDGSQGGTCGGCKMAGGRAGYLEPCWYESMLWASSVSCDWIPFTSWWVGSVALASFAVHWNDRLTKE